MFHMILVLNDFTLHCHRRKSKIVMFIFSLNPGPIYFFIHIQYFLFLCQLNQKNLDRTQLDHLFVVLL